MKSTAPLKALLAEWEDWAGLADKDFDGWQSCFPRWLELMAAAKALLTKSEFSQEEMAQLERCWLLSEEGEALVRFAEDNIAESREALSRLAESAHPEVRWQVFSALGEDGEFAEAVLRAGLTDGDSYCRRRAILALAKLRPHDALDLARLFLGDEDPYIRQASIDLVSVATPHPTALAILEGLLEDPASQVRNAAREELDRCLYSESRGDG